MRLSVYGRWASGTSQPLPRQKETNMKIRLTWLASGFVLGAAMILSQPALRAAPAPVAADEAREIAIEAYTYAYPMVLMEMTRRSTTNVETASGFHAPMNQFANLPGFPDASF